MGGPEAIVTGTACAWVIISRSFKSATNSISVISYTFTVTPTETGVCPEFNVIEASPFEE